MLCEARAGAGVAGQAQRGMQIREARMPREVFVDSNRAAEGSHQQTLAPHTSKTKARPARTVLLPAAAAGRAAVAPLLVLIVHADRAVAVRGIVRAKLGVAAAAAAAAGCHLAAAKVNIVPVLQRSSIRGGCRGDSQNW